MHQDQIVELGFLFRWEREEDMGGGNAQKSKMAREKNLEKAKAAAKGPDFSNSDPSN